MKDASEAKSVPEDLGVPLGLLAAVVLAYFWNELVASSSWLEGGHEDAIGRSCRYLYAVSQALVAVTLVGSPLLALPLATGSPANKRRALTLVVAGTCILAVLHLGVKPWSLSVGTARFADGLNAAEVAAGGHATHVGMHGYVPDAWSPWELIAALTKGQGPSGRALAADEVRGAWLVVFAGLGALISFAAPFLACIGRRVCRVPWWLTLAATVALVAAELTVVSHGLRVIASPAGVLITALPSITIGCVGALLRSRNGSALETATTHVAPA